MKRGFTLIEVLLALTITALIISFIYSSFWVTVKSYNTLTEKEGLYRSARVIMDKIGTQLQSAYLDYIPPEKRKEILPATFFIGIDDTINGLPSDKVIFSSLSGGYRVVYGEGVKPWGSSVELSYFVDIDMDNPDLLDLFCRQDTTLDRDPLSGGITYPMMFEVKGLNFRYYDKFSHQWYDNWDTRENGSYYLPHLVEISLYLPEPGAEDSEPVLFKEVVEIPYSIDSLFKPGKK